MPEWQEGQRVRIHHFNFEGCIGTIKRRLHYDPSVGLDYEWEVIMDHHVVPFWSEELEEV